MKHQVQKNEAVNIINDYIFDPNHNYNLIRDEGNDLHFKGFEAEFISYKELIYLKIKDLSFLIYDGKQIDFEILNSIERKSYEN